MKTIIGFANIFYTLWNYQVEKKYTTDAYGNHHLTGVNHKYYYLKNISKCLDKVKALFPDIEIDEELRGKTQSFERTQEIEKPYGYFWNGKYNGSLINEIIESDFDYCLWAVSNMGFAIRTFIQNHAKYIAHIEAIKAEKNKEHEESKKIFCNILNQNYIEFVAESNIKVSDVSVSTEDTHTFYYLYLRVDTIYIVFRFDKEMVSVKSYNGFDYGLPIINGKAKRMKGKTVRFEFTEGNWEKQEIKVNNIIIK